MPVPFPVSKVGSDKQKVEFLTIFGRPKTRFSDQISAEFRNFPKFPLATNHAVLFWRLVREGLAWQRETHLYHPEAALPPTPCHSPRPHTHTLRSIAQAKRYAFCVVGS